MKHFLKMLFSLQYRKSYWEEENNSLVDSVKASRESIRKLYEEAEYLEKKAAFEGREVLHCPQHAQVDLQVTLHMEAIAQNMSRRRILRRRLAWFT